MVDCYVGAGLVRWSVRWYGWPIGTAYSDVDEEYGLFFSLCCHLAYPANLCSHDAPGYWLEFHFGLTSPTQVDPQVIWLKVEFQTTMGGFMGHHSRSE